MTATPTCATKAGRAEMRRQIVALAQEYGFSVEQPPEAGRWQTLHVHTLRGLSAMLHVRGDGRRGDESQLMHWHYKTDSADTLALGVFHTINQFHRCKATDYVNDFPALLGTLRDRFDAIKDGTAFEEDAR